MKRLLLHVGILLSLPLLKAQTVPCFSSTMEESLATIVEQTVFDYSPYASQEQRNQRIGSYTLGKVEAFQKALESKPIDSLFRLALQHLQDHLGDAIVCERIYLTPQSFSHWRTKTEITFHYHISPHNITRGSYINFKYTFEKLEDHSYLITTPDYLPNCRIKPEDCQLQMTKALAALDRIAASTGFDISTPYSIFDPNRYFEIHLNTADSLGWQTSYTMDARTGAINTTRVARDTAFYQTGLEKKVQTADLIVEANLLRKTDGYFAQGNIYTSYILQVDRILKGNLQRDTLELPLLGGAVGDQISFTSHGPHIPNRGLFFLRQHPDGSSFRSADSSFNFPIVQLTSHCLNYDAEIHTLPPFWARNLHSYLYPSIERIVGHPLRQARPSRITNPRILKWFENTAPEKDSLPYEQGLQIGMTKTRIDGKTNRLIVAVAGQSVNGLSYPTRLRFLLRYNPEAFGQHLAGPGGIEVYREHNRWDIRPSTRPAAIFPPAYQTVIRDIEPGLLEITFTKGSNQERLLQLSDKFQDRYWYNRSPLFSFSLPILNDTAETQLLFVNPPYRPACYHFDYTQNKEVAYGFVKADLGKNFRISDRKSPQIREIKIDSLSSGYDRIVTIYGRHFLGKGQTAVEVLCERAPGDTTYYRIPDRYFRHRSESLIRFVLPDTLLAKPVAHIHHNSLKLVTGELFLINSIGTTEYRTKSEMKLKRP